MRRPPRPPSAPLITRRSTLGFGLLLFAGLASGPLLHAASGSGQARGSGSLGMAAAVALGVAAVSCAVVWVSGAVLAARRQSVVRLMVTIVLGPCGSIACALLMDGSTGSSPGGGR